MVPNRGDQKMNKPFNPIDYPICFEEPNRITSSAWIEHVPFAMFIIDLLQPKIFVELGTYLGVSYCAFCQAVKKLDLSTKCYAIDTWEGDQHGGFYGNYILDNLRSYHDPYYSGFSQLLQSTFDNAVEYFADSSIDLLHIDGLHTYDAVKHDFITWLPKLSSQAVVMFHDINVRENDFGVWQLWEELKEKYPFFEFFHGHGLGLIAVGSEYPASLDILVKTQKDQQRIRGFFQYLGQIIHRKLEITNQKEEITQKIENLNNLIMKKDQSIIEKEQSITEITQTISEINQAIIEKNQSIDSLNCQIVENDQLIESLESQINEKDQLIESLESQIIEKDQSIDSLSNQVTEKEQFIETKNAQLADNAQMIETLSRELTEKHQEILFYALSRSWKITRPLRKIMKIVRGIKNDNKSH